MTDLTEIPAPRRGFASDNGAGAHPAVLEALQRANAGHVFGYGADPFTERALGRFRTLFGDDAHAFFTYNGTGANVVGLASVMRPWEAVLCADTAHIHVDECGAPERFAGTKLIPVATPDGKLTPELLRPVVRGQGVVHHPQPRVVSISQPTEYGTLYASDELRELGRFAREHGLLVHMDGARFANAVAALQVDPRAITRELGVDVLSFGGTKNGLLFGEAVVLWDEAAAVALPYVRKQATQLASKMRFLAAQFDALLADGLWLETAGHANRMAARLAERVRGVPGVELTQPVQANAVFARLPAAALEPLQRRHSFYLWDASRAEVRWMTAWDTTEEDVDRFAEAVREEVGAAS